MVYLHVSFTVDAHNIEEYDRIFQTEFVPVLRELGFESTGIWKTLVGRAGEYIEIWKFQDAAEYERKWSALSSDPRVKAILAKTGPLVRGEEFRLLKEAGFRWK